MVAELVGVTPDCDGVDGKAVRDAFLACFGPDDDFLKPEEPPNPPELKPPLSNGSVEGLLDLAPKGSVEG